MNKNTFKFITKNNTTDKIEVEIGDSKVPDKFEPQIKHMRWNNESNVSIRLISDEKNAEVFENNKRIKWKGTDIEADFYSIENGYEFEITLNKKPKKNIIEFSLIDKDVEYFYQPELTKEEKKRGFIRNENVVGSYAIYTKTQKINYVDRKKYKIGKVGHIYRPKIIDNKNNSVWGELHIENKKLIVTIPQEFLDSASYPIKHAAGLTFGYTSIGASEIGGGTYQGYSIGQRGTSITGDLSSISVALRKDTGTLDGNPTAEIWTDGGSPPKPSGQEFYEIISGSSLTNSMAWYSPTHTYSFTGTNYWVVGGVPDAYFGGHVYIAYDTVSASYDNAENGGLWTGNSTIKGSVYATYTASGPTINTQTSSSTLTLGDNFNRNIQITYPPIIDSFNLTDLISVNQIADIFTKTLNDSFNLNDNLTIQQIADIFTKTLNSTLTLTDSVQALSVQTFTKLLLSNLGLNDTISNNILHHIPNIIFTKYTIT